MTDHELKPPLCSTCWVNERETNTDTCFDCKQETARREAAEGKAERKEHKRKALISEIDGHDPTRSNAAMKRAVLAILRGEV